MRSRAEVTTRYAKVYVKASKKDKGKVLDEVVSVTGWSRDNARRRLVAAAQRPPGAGRQVAKKPRKPRSPKYSYDTLRVLQRVWAASGGQCGKYLAASMKIQLDLLGAHGELVEGTDRYSPDVRQELLRWLRQLGARGPAPRALIGANPLPIACCPASPTLHGLSVNLHPAHVGRSSRGSIVSGEGVRGTGVMQLTC